MTNARPVRTLLPMACDGVGPSMTCVNILTGMHNAGYEVDIFATRQKMQRLDAKIRVALPGPLAKLPYRWIGAQASKWIEHQFLRNIGPDDVAYLWPAVSLETHRILHDRGIPIVLEGINTRMAWARRILDVAYADFGIEPIHGITDIRIQEEEAKYEYATAIFAPNMNVEKALAGSPLEQHVLSSSYGVDTTKASPERSYRENHDLTFIFCGYACVRKGAHYMLEAWKDMPGNHKLQLVGKIEPVIAERYRDLLASDRVEVVGFVDDVHAYFSRADVFLMPSLEEGGPQVTYEAALHGLPIIASAMGASRLGDTPGSMIIIDPAQISDFREAMEELVASTERREALGRKARQLAFEFDWMDVGARRAGSLEEYFA